MPLFISHSHADKAFVDRLATQLVAHHVSVWLDRWEIHVGDSLLNKVQNAITGASGLLVILSKASVASEWCNKEINSGLMRELAEKRVVLLPVLIEDCDIPLFLREKMYADFRKDFDEGLRAILEAVAAVTNESQGRLDKPEWHTDYAVDWGEKDGCSIFRLTMIEQAKAQPYVVLGIVELFADEDVTGWYKAQEAQGKDRIARRDIVRALANRVGGDARLVIRIDDQQEIIRTASFSIDEGTFDVILRVRRLGMDTGRSVLFEFGNQIEGVADAMHEITRQAGDVEGSAAPTPAPQETSPPAAAKKKAAAKVKVVTKKVVAKARRPAPAKAKGKPSAAARAKRKK